MSHVMELSGRELRLAARALLFAAGDEGGVDTIEFDAAERRKMARLASRLAAEARTVGTPVRCADCQEKIAELG